MELLEKAAKQGHAYAMQWLGNIHDAREEYEHAVVGRCRWTRNCP